MKRIYQNVNGTKTPIPLAILDPDKLQAKADLANLEQEITAKSLSLANEDDNTDNYKIVDSGSGLIFTNSKGYVMLPIDGNASTVAMGSEVTQLAQEVGSLDDLETTEKESIVKAINELNGKGGGSWETLVDNTTTEAISQWSFTQGEDGQVFDDYKQICVFFIAQPNEDGTTNTLLRLRTQGTTAWSSNTGTQCCSVGFGSTSSTITTYGITILEKTSIGIICRLYQCSYNVTTMSSCLSNYNYSNLTYSTFYDSNKKNDSEIPLDTNFNAINLGSYTKVLGAGSRIVVLGKK